MDLDIYDIARRGTTKEMKAFIKSGIDLNKKNKYGWNPLHIAIAERKEDMAILLLENGADASIQDNDGNTALHYAMLWTMPNIAKIIIEKNPQILHIADKYDAQPLWTAISNGELTDEFLEFLLQKGADKNYGIKGGTPLDLVKTFNSKELTELFEKY